MRGFEGAVGQHILGCQVGILAGGTAQQVEQPYRSKRIELVVLQRNLAVVQLFFCLEIDVSGGSEVPPGSVIGAFTEVDGFDGFRDEEMEVGVALTVGVGNHVDRQAVDRNANVCSVVDIETAQEDLFGFTASGVLGDKQARHLAQYFLGRDGRVVLQVDGGDLIYRTQLFGDHHLFQPDGRFGQGNTKRLVEVGISEHQLAAFKTDKADVDRIAGLYATKPEGAQFVGVSMLRTGVADDVGILNGRPVQIGYLALQYLRGEGCGTGNGYKKDH